MFISTFFSNLCHVVNEWIRQHTDTVRDAETLPYGVYIRVSPENKEPTIQRWRTGFKATVYGKGRSWTILAKHPVADGIEVLLEDGIRVVKPLA